MVKPLKCHEALERIEDPAELPVSLTEAKAHMRVTSSAEDAFIRSSLDAAVSFVDGMGVLGRAMVTQKWRQYAPPNPGTVRLKIATVQTVTKIGYYDPDGAEQTATLAEFDVFGNGEASTVQPKPGNSWPATQQRPDAIWVEYEAGYGAAADVPPEIKHAIKMLTAHYEYQRVNSTEKPLSDVPFGFSDLIGAHRVSWYG